MATTNQLLQANSITLLAATALCSTGAQPSVVYSLLYARCAAGAGSALSKSSRGAVAATTPSSILVWRAACFRCNAGLAGTVSWRPCGQGPGQ